MLVIRNVQLATLQGGARREFEDRLVAILGAEFPGAKDVRKMVEHAIAVGAERGVDSEGGVTALAALMIQYGAVFERSPDRGWAMGILEHPSMPGALKMDLLLERMAKRAQGRVVVTQGDD